MIPECAKHDLWTNNMRAKAESRESMTVMNSMQFQTREGKVKMLYLLLLNRKLPVAMGHKYSNSLVQSWQIYIFTVLMHILPNHVLFINI